MNFRARFTEYGDRTALVCGDEPTSYEWLASFPGHTPAGTITIVAGGFDPSTLRRLFFYIEQRAIVVPAIHRTPADARLRGAHPYYDTLRERNHAGLVLFTSGSSGTPKAAVHDLDLLLKKFETRRPAKRTLAFMSFDHWGGLNTMFHTLSNGGTLVVPKSRKPVDVCAAIEKHGVEVLPVTPSFLNLLLASGAYHDYDLSSLETISYGTEPMPDTTRQRLTDLFPHITLHQTYGLIELGVLRSQSKTSDSPWVKIGGEGYEVRVVDGLLEIKAESAMLGYLNAPSPANPWTCARRSNDIRSKSYPSPRRS